MSKDLKDMVVWLEARCKEHKTRVDEAQASLSTRCVFEEAEYYERNLMEARAVLAETVSIKIATERFMKLRAHEAAEALKGV